MFQEPHLYDFALHLLFPDLCVQGYLMTQLTISKLKMEYRCWFNCMVCHV